MRCDGSNRHQFEWRLVVRSAISDKEQPATLAQGQPPQEMEQRSQFADASVIHSGVSYCISVITRVRTVTTLLAIDSKTKWSGNP